MSDHKKTSGKGNDALIDPAKLLGRRDFVAFAGLSAAIASLEGCIRRPEEKILPYTHAPEYMIPGVPLHYASVLAHRGDAVGVLVKSHEGRPTKIEGNPEHHSSLGSTDAVLQAELLNLYDAERSRSVIKSDGQAKSSWQSFSDALNAELKTRAEEQGQGLRFLSLPSVSPTEQRLREAVLARFPKAAFHVYSAIDRSATHKGSSIAFGKPLHAQVDFAIARTILALDSNFLSTEVGSIRAAREFARARRVYSEHDGMLRLYVVESAHSLTGANADHRLALASSQIANYLKALCAELSTSYGLDFGPLTASVAGAKASDVPEKWIKAVAKELYNHRGLAPVLVGQGQPAAVHALAHALNSALGNVGMSLSLCPVVEDIVEEKQNDLATLVADMQSGQVSTLIVLGGNPVYNAPGDLAFADALSKVKFSAHLSTHFDESSEKCTWHLPLAHGLESWGDLRGLDGTLAIQQPLIAPLFGGRSVIELLAMVAGEKDYRGYGQVRQSFATLVGSSESNWRKALHQGVVEESAFEKVSATADFAAVNEALAAHKNTAAPKADALELAFGVDPRMEDGRNANNAWLLELPDSMTSICWDNAALFAPKTAKALGLVRGDMVQLSGGAKHDTSVSFPVFLLPGMAENTAFVATGWGRAKGGKHAKGAGFNASALRQSTAMYLRSGMQVSRTAKHYTLVQVQEHAEMEGRPLALSGTLDEYRAQPDFAQYESVEPPVGPLWKEQVYDGHKWGMSIDLNACTGCNAYDCVSVGKQHCDRRQRASAKRSRDALDSHRSLL
ncbi:MAG: molybdopterin oxidoreductase [Myxococcales bacterium]|nr:MAG: molybdopterin oxidoreductase [Myxococcales bacterium]